MTARPSCPGCLAPSHSPWNAAKSVACTRRPVSRRSAGWPNAAARPGTGAERPDSLPQRGLVFPQSPRQWPTGALCELRVSRAAPMREVCAIQGPFGPRGYAGALSMDGIHQHQEGWGLQLLRAELRIREVAWHPWVEEEIPLCFPGGLQSIRESGITSNGSHSPHSVLCTWKLLPHTRHLL